MKNKRFFRQLNIFVECRELGLPLWECPSFLFAIMGLITIVLMISTYIIAQIYYNINIVLAIISIGTGSMVIIMFLVERGVTKIAESERSLKQSHKELRYAFEKLKQAEKIREEFTSTLIHDLRSPLNGIRLLSELLQNRSDERLDTNTIKESVDMINYNTVSVLNLINDILEAAKIKAKKFKIFKEWGDLKKVIERVFKFFTPLAKEKNLKIKLNHDTNVPHIDFDHKKVEQVINNLLANAIQFTESGGEIKIYTLNHQKSRSIKEEAKKAKIKWPLDDEHYKQLKDIPRSVIIAISDSGVGIPEEYIDRMFEEVRQMRLSQKIQGKGTGMGLIICKGIIEAHGGKIGVESKVKKGTTFFFNLPY